ncbi:hypothetical protein HYG77_31950 (plasmid) [Rhodococcus sp. ZPP]|uniref:hypothetical protein n=1 Tax=Rhodococcus sp. ZPP TaxID=2749906 RepID=UPI001AD8642C|nr:hypothetical protein [Rhodococcus sp. ZPP]QTJ70194.1 hypothetical protein HYG77_31950 [Rhodococcus sp. ZPP]
MTTAQAVAAAVTFVWFGMVLAISFLETPLKFRAPGGPVRVGLGIDRLVFRVVKSHRDRLGDNTARCSHHRHAAHRCGGRRK